MSVGTVSADWDSSSCTKVLILGGNWGDYDRVFISLRYLSVEIIEAHHDQGETLALNPSFAHADEARKVLSELQIQ